MTFHVPLPMFWLLKCFTLLHSFKILRGFSLLKYMLFWCFSGVALSKYHLGV